MYAFVNRNPDNAVLIMRFDDPDRAINVLEQAEVPIIKADELASA